MGLVNYIKESFKELNNEVTWITLNDAQKQTVLVVVFTIIFALAIFATDKIRIILTKGKNLMERTDKD